MEFGHGLHNILFLSCVNFCACVLNDFYVETFLANKCKLFDDDVIIPFTSYTGCVEHCQDKGGCVAINFMQKSSICRLNFQTSTTGECQGYQYSKKENWAQSGSGQCSCPRGRSCSGGQCMPSECARLDDPDRGKVIGSRYGRGDKVTYMCDRGTLPAEEDPRRICGANGQWSGTPQTCAEVGLPACENPVHLVTGPDGVPDSQLSQSSSYCDLPGSSFLPFCQPGRDPVLTAQHARLGSQGYHTGCWVAGITDTNQYIQVEFTQEKTISSIVLQGMGPNSISNYYVTSFKVLYSLDCVNFTELEDASGDPVIFDGNTSGDGYETVVRDLPERVMARCVRINPTSWATLIGLRFDVLGC